MSATTTATIAPSDVFQLRRRRMSTPNLRRPTSRALCLTLPYSLEALDLRSMSPVQTLASLRYLVLSYLAELEQRLSAFEPEARSDYDAWRTTGELTIEEARQWANTAMDKLKEIREDVRKHLPELRFSGLADIRAHLPDLPIPDVPSIEDMRSHLLEVRSHLPDLDEMLSKFNVRTRFHDLDFNQPLTFVPTLSEHLNDLHTHLSSIDLPSGLEVTSQFMGSLLSDMIDKVMNSEVMADILAAAPDIAEGEAIVEKTAKDVARAIKRSFEGVKLIRYSDLPHQWRNNPFVTHGYRFIPIERWPLIILSLFAFHNETLNIHTHLIPFILWTANSIPYINPTAFVDTAETIFTLFALLCLFTSALWHTMSGCAHPASMEFCARVDYVGIGWLISASVGTLVYYGFQCHPDLTRFFLCLCLMTGVLGSVCPFMSWFNDIEYRGWRIVFFLVLAFSSLAPLAALAYLHSPGQMASFISPVVPSLVSYITGLVFYASHIPERFLPEHISSKLDFVGGGSHCIWHCFIVLAVSQHKAAIRLMKEGIVCSV